LTVGGVAAFRGAWGARAVSGDGAPSVLCPTRVNSRAKPCRFAGSSTTWSLQRACARRSESCM